MSFSRVNGGGWAVGDVLTAAQINALDIDHANAADKTTANDTIVGTWSFVAATANLAFSSVSPGITLAVAANKINAGSGKVIIDGSGLVTVGAGGLLKTTGGGAIQLGTGPGDVTFLAAKTVTRFIPAEILNGGWSYATGDVFALGQAGGSAFFELPLYAYDGATITSVASRFVPKQTHGSVPTNYPQFQLWRRDLSVGSNATPATLKSTGYAIFPTPSPNDVTTYQGGALVQSWTYTPDRNNVVDYSKYRYYLEVIDENGGGAINGNNYHGFLVTMTMPGLAGLF